MAFTYILLNGIFIAVIMVIFARHLRKPNKAWSITLIALLALTLIFDNLMLWAGFFSYDTTKLLGLYIGLAPVEDFFYALLAALIVPLLWSLFDTPHKGKA
jgi:lycopene cyclase domain-containing protein